MLLTSTATALASAGTVTARELPMPAWAFGAIAFGSFIVLLGVLWSFRNTAARYDKPDPGAHH